MKKHLCIAAVAAILLLWVLRRPATALPAMVRLGYSNCAVCHISPQGGGLLNAYGRSIDHAQCLRGGDYKSSTNHVAKWLSWGGMITQDVRSVTQEQKSTTATDAVVGTLPSWFMYRNAT